MFDFYCLFLITSCFNGCESGLRLAGSKVDTAHMANTIQPGGLRCEFRWGLGHIAADHPCDWWSIGWSEFRAVFRMAFELPNRSPWSMFASQGDHMSLTCIYTPNRTWRCWRVRSTQEDKAVQTQLRQAPPRQLFSNSPIYRQLGLCKVWAQALRARLL